MLHDFFFLSFLLLSTDKLIILSLGPSYYTFLFRLSNLACHFQVLWVEERWIQKAAILYSSQGWPPPCVCCSLRFLEKLWRWHNFYLFIKEYETYAFLFLSCTSELCMCVKLLVAICLLCLLDYDSTNQRSVF